MVYYNTVFPMGNNFNTTFKLDYPINIVKQQLNEFW